MITLHFGKLKALRRQNNSDLSVLVCQIELRPNSCQMWPTCAHLVIQTRPDNGGKAICIWFKPKKKREAVTTYIWKIEAVNFSLFSFSFPITFFFFKHHLVLWAKSLEVLRHADNKWVQCCMWTFGWLLFLPTLKCALLFKHKGLIQSLIWAKCKSRACYCSHYSHQTQNKIMAHRNVTGALHKPCDDWVFGMMIGCQSAWHSIILTLSVIVNKLTYCTFMPNIF